MSLNAEETKIKELRAEIARTKIFLGLLQESCFDILNGADNSIKPEVKVDKSDCDTSYFFPLIFFSKIFADSSGDIGAIQIRSKKWTT